MNDNIATQDPPEELQPTAASIERLQYEDTLNTSEREIAQLAPTDRGREAWQVLIAAFVFDALFWGFPTSFGIFQAHYSAQPQFSKSTASIPVIGTLAQGLYYLGAPFSAAMTKRFPQYQKHQILFGWPLCILGLLTASFCDSVPGLIATQGILYGFGFVVFTYPIVSMVSEWWIARKGMAFGLISASSGLAGIALPLILEALLARYGYKITLRACAVAMVVLTAPLIPLLKGRLPQGDVAQQARTDWSFLRKSLFWVYAVATVVQGFGFFIPPIFVPSYAVSLGLPAGQAALLLALMSTAQTLGQFAFGWLSDTKLSVSVLMSTCCVVAAVATVTMWGFGKSLTLLIPYSIVYGFFAFGFGTMRVAMGRAVSSEQSAVLATYSTFVFLQGIGNVMVGPIVAALMSRTFNPVEYGATQYKDIIIFVSATSMLGGAVVLVPHVYKVCTSLLR